MSGTDRAVPENGPSLREQLADLWSARKTLDFFALVEDKLSPKVCAALRKKYRLTVEDAEDCFAAAVEGYIARYGQGRGQAENPAGVLSKSAHNAAVDMIRARERAREIGEAAAVEAGVPLPGLGGAHPSSHGAGPDAAEYPRNSVILVEAVVEDVDADPGWAVQVVAVAIERLPPKPAAVAQYLLAHGVDPDPEDALADLQMTAGTYRSNKKRAYDGLRELIPGVMEELQIAPREQRIVAVFHERYEFARVEGEER